MKNIPKLLLALCCVCAWTLPPAALQAREVSLPVPTTVSPALQDVVGRPLPKFWKQYPKTTEEWREWSNNFSEAGTQAMQRWRAQLGVSMERATLGGVPVFILTPKDLSAANAQRVLLHFHGGGYVLGAGEAGTQEALLMASLGKFKVIAVDYRLAPDHPYPGAIDDAVAVYREVLKTTPAEKIGVFGSSTGGAMTLILALRAKADGLPLPAALGAGSPWADLTKTGDSYYANEGVDNQLGGYEGWLSEAAKVYAAGHDMKDPLLSPVYGDVRGFPPTLLTSGTRDLFLSNTVRMHLKLREAGVVADLMVFEALSHVQYHLVPSAPETQWHFTELARFFGKHLQ